MRTLEEGRRTSALVVGALVAVLAASTAHATPFATTVVSYDPGTGVTVGLDDPSASLGSPSRTTGGPSDVTIFNSPFAVGDVTSIGAGGHLTLRFDAKVVDDALNPFGVDLLVFGNAFFTLDFETFTSITGVFEEPGTISVSQDGISFLEITGTVADALFPTQGYLDTSDPFGGFGGFGDGTIESDFERPVDPSLDLADFLGRDYAGALALYGNSGGGAPIDLASVGLPWIQYVRIDVVSGTTEIDAVSDVRALPEPAVGLLLGATLIGVTRKRAG